MRKKDLDREIFLTMLNPLVWVIIFWYVLPLIPSLISTIYNDYKEKDKRPHKFLKILFSYYENRDMGIFNYPNCYICNKKANWVGFAGEIFLCCKHMNQKDINKELER